MSFGSIALEAEVIAVEIDVLEHVDVLMALEPAPIPVESHRRTPLYVLPLPTVPLRRTHLLRAHINKTRASDSTH